MQTFPGCVGRQPVGVAGAGGEVAAISLAGARARSCSAFLSASWMRLMFSFRETAQHWPGAAGRGVHRDFQARPACGRPAGSSVNPPASDRRDFVQLEFARDFLHHVRRHGPQTVHIGVDQGVLAQQIHHARYSVGIVMDCLNGFLGKNRLAVGSRDAQSLGDVAEGLLQRKRGGAAAQSNALPKLAQLRQLQLFFQFGLARKNDLQKLFGGSLEIRQQPDFLQNFGGEVLRLVDDQNRCFPGAVPFEQPLIQAHQNLALFARFAGNFEFRHDEIEQLIYVQAGIENVGGGHALPAKPVQQAVQQGRLAGADFSRQQDESLAVLNAVGQPRQRFLNLPCQVQIARVGIDVKRALAKPKEFLVHGIVRPSLRESRSNRRAATAAPACFVFLLETGSIAGTMASTGKRSANSTSRSLRIEEFCNSRNKAMPTPRAKPAAQAAQGEHRAVRERRLFRQVCGIENAELLALLFALQFRGHRRVVALLLQLVIRLERRLIAARQFLVLLLHARAGLHPVLDTS